MTKLRISTAACLAVIFMACATHGVGTPATIRGKYFQARTEYANLLVAANEYKQSPTADPVLVAKIQEIDLKVQAAEQEVDTMLLSGDLTGASSKLDFFILAVQELKHQLLIRGIIKLEGQ